AQIIAVEYLPPRNQIVVSCNDRSLQFFTCRPHKNKPAWTCESTWTLNTSQICLEYAGKNNYTIDGLSAKGTKQFQAASSTAGGATVGSTTTPATGASGEAGKGAAVVDTTPPDPLLSTPLGPDPSELSLIPEEEIGSAQLSFNLLFTA